MSYPFNSTHERILHARWSSESLQDFQSEYNLDAYQILNDLLVEEVAREMDVEILNNIQTRHHLYISPEEINDINAWSGYISPEDIDAYFYKEAKTHNWKQEGF